MKKDDCTYTFEDCLDCDKKGTPRKWQLHSDCGINIIMTKTNEFWRLFKESCKPHTQGTVLGVKCPFCGKELTFFNPYED
jgi:hypothetical protein